MVERKEYLDELIGWKDEQVIKAVTGIQVEENAGYLDVSWNAAEQAWEIILAMMNPRS